MAERVQPHRPRRQLDGPNVQQLHTGNPSPVLSVADEVEVAAAAQQERENIAIVPASAEDLVAATVTSVHHGSLECLASAATAFEEITDQLIVIEERIRIYLERAGRTGELRHYPQVLATAAATPERLTNEQRAYAQRIQALLVSELNPLLYTLQQTIQATFERNKHLSTQSLWRQLAEPGGVLQVLAQGRVGQQATYSLFGVIQHLHQQDAAWPAFDLAAPTVPGTGELSWVAEFDPLDAATQKEYWRTYLQVHHEAGRTLHLPEAIQLRSEAAAYELNQSVEHGAMSEAQTAAYDIVIDWVEDQIDRLQPVTSAADLGEYRATLHFAHGDPVQVIALLNALETVKQHNPNLWMRLLGVAPGHDYSTQSAQRSDLFGSVLHIALQRSLQLELPSDNTATTTFRTRVRGLLDVQTALPEMTYISDEQMSGVERFMRQKIQDLPPEERTATTAVTMAVAYMPFLPGYALRKGLEQMLDAVSLEEREYTLQRLRQAAPNEFIQTTLNMSVVLQHDPDIQAAVRQRLSEVLSNIERLQGGELDSVLAVVSFLRQRRQFTQSNDERQTAMQEIRSRLWATTPGETMLRGDEWLQDCVSIVQQIRQQRIAIMQRERSNPQQATLLADSDKRLAQPVLAVLQAHPEITAEQWHGWYQRMTSFEAARAQRLSARLVAGVRSQVGLRFGLDTPTVDRVVDTLVTAIGPIGMRDTDTQFYRIIPQMPGHDRYSVVLDDDDPCITVQHAVEFLFRAGQVDMSELSFPDCTRILLRMISPEQLLSNSGPDFISQISAFPIENFFAALPTADAKRLLTALCQPELTGRLGWNNEVQYRLGDVTGNLPYYLQQHYMGKTDSTHHLYRQVNYDDVERVLVNDEYAGYWQTNVLRLADAYGVRVDNDKIDRWWKVVAFPRDYMAAWRMVDGAYGSGVANQQIQKLLGFDRLPGYQANVSNAVFELSVDEARQATTELEQRLRREITYRLGERYDAEHDIVFQFPQTVLSYDQPYQAAGRLPPSERRWAQQRAETLRHWLDILPSALEDLRLPLQAAADEAEKQSASAST